MEDEKLKGNNWIGRKFGKFSYLFIFVIVVGLIGGLLGGLGGVVLLSTSDVGSRLRSSIGLKNLNTININHTNTEKIVVEESSAITKAVDKVKPAVVSITGQPQQTIFGFSLGQTAGSGFIITSDGLIITNKHVVSDEGAQYNVYTADGKKYAAKVLARDPYNDLAVLKIDATSLPVVELGDSDQLVIGQWVIAIGNALGEFQNTVTVGVVSGKNRQVTPTDASTGQTEQLDGLIQTDAALFSGNSGGPMLNLDGQVVGINTVKGSDQGLGFAIPINSIKNAIDSVEKYQRIIRPMLGVRYQIVTPELAKSYNLPVDYGALIYGGQGQDAIVADSPAAKAGLEQGDIIIEINGERIDENYQLKNALEKYKPGDEVEVKIMRDKKQKTVRVKLAELK